MEGKFNTKTLSIDLSKVTHDKIYTQYPTHSFPSYGLKYLLRNARYFAVCRLNQPNLASKENMTIQQDKNIKDPCASYRQNITFETSSRSFKI